MDNSNIITTAQVIADEKEEQQLEIKLSLLDNNINKVKKTFSICIGEDNLDFEDKDMTSVLPVL